MPPARRFFFDLSVRTQPRNRRGAKIRAKAIDLALDGHGGRTSVRRDPFEVDEMSWFGRDRSDSSQLHSERPGREAGAQPPAPASRFAGALRRRWDLTSWGTTP